MGSYRDLYVTVEGAELYDIETALDHIVDGYEFYKITSDDCLHCNVSTRYDYNNDFSQLSKQFPNAIITLEIHPEEIYFNGISRVYYCNGDWQEEVLEIISEDEAYQIAKEQLKRLL